VRRLAAYLGRRLAGGERLVLPPLYPGGVPACSRKGQRGQPSEPAPWFFPWATQGKTKHVHASATEARTT